MPCFTFHLLVLCPGQTRDFSSLTQLTTPLAWYGYVLGVAFPLVVMVRSHPLRLFELLTWLCGSLCSRSSSSGCASSALASRTPSPSPCCSCGGCRTASERLPEPSPPFLFSIPSLSLSLLSVCVKPSFALSLALCGGVVVVRGVCAAFVGLCCAHAPGTLGPKNSATRPYAIMPIVRTMPAM